MKLLLPSHIHILSTLLVILGLANCATNTSKKTINDFPVSWNTGFTMPAILEKSDIPLNGVSDLSKLISARWYADIYVIKTKVGETVFSSCMDYFDNATPATHTKNDYEMGAFLEFKVMCQATQLLLNARNSKESFLPDIILNDDVAKYWPKEIALITATEESKRISQNKNLLSWADVTPIINIEKNSESKSTYFHKGGYQEVEIVGNGDANNDNVEDVFIVVRDHLDDGNYFNIRLLVLTKNTGGSWELIKSF